MKRYGIKLKGKYLWVNKKGYEYIKKNCDWSVLGKDYKERVCSYDKETLGELAKEYKGKIVKLR